MRAILLGPAEPKFSDLKRRLKALAITERDLLIGVDGGIALWLKAGYWPKTAVGDWDSFPREKLPSSIEAVTLPREKDRSDLFHAIEYALAHGATKLVALGVTGGRPDHHLAGLQELAAAAARKHVESVEAIGPDGEYHFLSRSAPRWAGSLARGQTLSVFPLGGTAEGVTLTGLKYSLKNGRIRPSSQGLSNEAVARRCEVRLRSGNLVVVIPYDR